MKNRNIQFKPSAGLLIPLFLGCFAANGDEISGTFEGYLCPTETPGVYDNHETAEVTGGTGRFANATGHFELVGQLDFTTNPPSFVLPWQGVISSVGSKRH